METYASSKIQSWLPWFLRGMLFLGFLFLLARLADLTIIRGAYFRSLSENNRIRRIPIIAARGKILARGGETLVGNTNVKALIEFDPESGYTKKYTDDPNADEVITEPLRNYVLAEKFAHVSGYLGEADENEVGMVNPKCPEKGEYALGSLIGKTGLEKEYECQLRGLDGEELTEVDSMGRKVRVLGRKEPVPGSDIKTSIDWGLQQKVSGLLDGQKGAIIVTDKKGEILALYSSPSYDPNIFTDAKKGMAISKTLTDENLPLFNRSLGGIYHPGSVVKPLIAAAALEEGVIDKDFRYVDEGTITINSEYGTYTYRNWYLTQYGGTEGEIDLTRALARSTDTFFYKTGELLGIDAIDKWLTKFGLGEKTGVDLPTEVAGLVPSPEWKRLNKGERWFLGNTYHVSIGQGDIAITPLAINQAISSIANDGIYCKPHFVSDEDMVTRKDYCRSLNISGDNLMLVKQGMVGVCSDGGTAYPFFGSPISVACKTGTAETDEKDKTHAWFVFFSPVDLSTHDNNITDKPGIVSTVLVEKAGEGSQVAAPIAKEIYNYWFSLSDVNKRSDTNFVNSD
jgi:penicillin-binding protein 2